MPLAPDEIEHEDLKWAVALTVSCGSDRSCIKSGTCLGRPVCAVVRQVGNTAGFVEPTASAEHCGYCTPSFRGFLCFCPTRWALFRARDAAK
ncbi:MAG: hypothetical protein HZC24_10935 [Rhodocyclales bacterium]|nr:hypothetical protein [Rhodocyclales bacterium]